MNILKRLISVVLVLGIIASMSCINVFALENGTYNVDTVTHYLNPDTGKTDDGGTGNAELGEGMCRSAVGKTAVVEQKAGSVDITMTMLLYSNLSNIRFALKNSNGQYDDIKYSIIKESSSNDSADLKFNAPSADTMVRVKMYVAPMGRDVCFYWNCDTNTAVKSGDEVNKTENISDESKIENKFSDINKHWAEKDIMSVVNKGLFSGITATTFEPETSMTRGMFVTVLGRLSGETISGTSNFADVDSGKYYSPYIAWASSKGIVSGTSTTSFNPDASVTCEQAALIITKYAEYKGINFDEKSISPSTTGVSSWAKDYVVKAGKAGVITKQNTNGYNYTSSATRADVASMLNNFMEYYVK